MDNSLIVSAQMENSLVEPEKTVTTRELAQILGVDVSTITKTVKRLLGSTSQKSFGEIKTISNGGRPTKVFTEKQASLIKMEIEKHHNAGLESVDSDGTRQIEKVSTDYEMELMTQKVLTYHIQKANEYKEMADKAQAKVLELQPKAEFAEAISDSEDLLIMGDVCKVLGLKYGCITLYKHLVTLGVLNQQHIPYQEFVNRGYFKLCENKITDSYGKTHVTITTKVYQKGVKYIMELLKKNNLFNSTMAS